MKRSRRRRGVVLIWFALLFLLVFSFTGLISIDYGAVIYARSEVRSATSEAALRAARQYAQDESSEQAPLLFDETAARAAALEVLNDAGVSGALRRATVISSDVTFLNNGPENSLWYEQPLVDMKVPRVVVSVTYEVRDLRLLDLGRALIDESQTPNTVTLSESAVICVPGLNPDTLQGACQRSDA